MNAIHAQALLTEAQKLLATLSTMAVHHSHYEGLRNAIAAATEPQADNSAVIDRARQMYADCGANDDIEIDSNAQVSETDDGTWVQAWVWVPNEEDDEDEDDEDDEDDSDD